MGKYNAFSQKRMDLLGYLGEEIGDTEHPHQESHIKTERRNAPALLLVRLSASVKKGVEKAILSCSELRTMFGGLFKRKNHGLADYIYFACQQINPCHR